MEHEGPLLCSQQPDIGPYPEPDESSPHRHTFFFKIHFSNTFPSTHESPKWSLSVKVFSTELLYIFHISSHVCYTPENDYITTWKT